MRLSLGLTSCASWHQSIRWSRPPREDAHVSCEEPRFQLPRVAKPFEKSVPRFFDFAPRIYGHEIHTIGCREARVGLECVFAVFLRNFLVANVSKKSFVFAFFSMNLVGFGCCGCGRGVGQRAVFANVFCSAAAQLEGGSLFTRHREGTDVLVARHGSRGIESSRGLDGGCRGSRT